MRWAYKEPPAEGDWRFKTRFAWLPVVTTLPKKEVIWLEFYQTNDKYVYEITGKLNWCTMQIAENKYFRGKS